MDLKQRKLLITKEFTFKESGINIKVKNLTSSQEVEIPFEEINLKKIIKQSKTDGLITVVCAFFGVIFLLGIILKISGKDDITWSTILLFLVFTILSGLITYVNYKRLILIPTANNGHFEILDGNPTKEITDRFINNLTLKTNSYLKNKYGQVDKDLPIDPQLTNLMWLKERNILKEEEFIELKNKLLGKRDNNSIGFK